MNLEKFWENDKKLCPYNKTMKTYISKYYKIAEL